MTHIVYLPVYFSDAARVSGITVIVKGANVDQVFTKLVFQAMNEVQVVHTLVMIDMFNKTLSIQQSQPSIFYKIYLLQPGDTSLDHLMKPFQNKLPVSILVMGEIYIVA